LLTLPSFSLLSSSALAFASRGSIVRSKHLSSGVLTSFSLAGLALVVEVGAGRILYIFGGAKNTQ
jgi:hypothetical protein